MARPSKVARPDDAGTQLAALIAKLVDERVTGTRRVSQRTVEAATGIDARHFLESLAAYRVDGGLVTSVGKLRVVVVEDWLRWIDRRGATPQKAANDSAPAEDESDVERLERELGIGVRR